MPIEVLMPQMGESIAEGTIIRWLKGIGEAVQLDEPLFEISTDKVNAEIPSPADGILEEIVVPEGGTVPIRTVVAIMRERDAACGSPGAHVSIGLEGEGPAGSPAAGIPRPKSSPLVRRIAREYGIRLEDVTGTGLDGRVRKEDILAHVAEREKNLEGPAPAGAAGKSPDPGGVPPVGASLVRARVPSGLGLETGSDRVEPLSPVRRAIAEHMVRSRRTAAHATTIFEIDMSGVVALREHMKDDFQRRNSVKLTYLPFIVQAAVEALKSFPVFNASLDDRGENVVYHRGIHIGIAVALEEGLIVPVIRNADERNILGLARALDELVRRARAGSIDHDELRGGTFTITNHGSFGSILGAPILPQPQVAILGVGAVTKRPVVLPGTDAIAVRSMAFFSLSFDHRLVDGALADRFLGRVKKVLEAAEFRMT